MLIYTKGGDTVDGVDGQYRNADYFEGCERTDKVFVSKGYDHIANAYKDAGVEVSVIGDNPSKLTVDEIKAQLDDKGINYPSDAKKAELLALLQG